MTVYVPLWENVLAASKPFDVEPLIVFTYELSEVYTAMLEMPRDFM